MPSIRILIVEDDEKQLAQIKGFYKQCFLEQLDIEPEFAEARSFAEAARLAKSQSDSPKYDLVSLDVNLGDSAKTGLDVLQIFNAFNSAWMVALLTGVETDRALDKTLGKEKGGRIRNELRRDAYLKFPAERLVVVEKPAPTLKPAEQAILLESRVNQIVLLYEQISMLRYVFRRKEFIFYKKIGRSPVECKGVRWEIRFDSEGPITLEDELGFTALQRLLAGESLAPEDAILCDTKYQEKNKKSVKKVASKNADPDAPFVEFCESQGKPWGRLSGSEQEAVRKKLAALTERYRELFLLRDEGGLEPAEEKELVKIEKQLGPLLEDIEKGLEGRSAPMRMVDAESESIAEAMAKGEMRTSNTEIIRDENEARGVDSKEGQLFRVWWMRLLETLAENGFGVFVSHLKERVLSVDGKRSYSGGIEWTTR
jgi:CheY-like chemotaxis protein